MSKNKIMKNKIIITVVILVLGAFGLYQYAYKSQRDISTEKAEMETNVKNLESEFAMNDSLANIKYLDKTINIYGKITNIDLKTKSIVLDEKVYITFLNNVSSTLKLQNNVKVKGRFIGFDDLLSEFRIDQATIQE
jgi:preprotein translocase subunit YajC